MRCGRVRRLADAQRVYDCVKNTGDAAAMIETCGKGIGDEKTRKAAACVARAEGDKDKLLGCAAQSALPGETGRLAGCAAASDGSASSFGHVCGTPSREPQIERGVADCR